MTDNSKFNELEDIVYENTILIKKNRALVSINHDNLHGAYRESYDITRELLLLQLDRVRKFLSENEVDLALFNYLKKRIEINKKTAEVTEKIIKSNELMMEALEASRIVNEELVTYLDETLDVIESKKTLKNKAITKNDRIDDLFAMQKENIINIFRNNSKVNQNRKKIQEKVAQVEILSNKAQDLVANFHQLLYKDR